MCFKLTLPAICVPAVALPLVMPAALLSSNDVGGVLI